MDAYIRFYCPLEENTQKASIVDVGHVDLQVNCGSTTFSFPNSDTNGNNGTHSISVTNPVISFGNSKLGNNRGEVTIYSSSDSAAHVDHALLCRYQLPAITNTNWDNLKTELLNTLEYNNGKLLVKNSSHPLYTYNFHVRHCMYATAYWCKTYLGFDGLMQDYYLKFTNPNDPNDEGYKNYTCWKLFADKCKFLIYDMIKMS